MNQIIASKSNSGSIVNKVGKYLKQHIDGAFKIEFKPMECVVTMLMYYQMPDQPETFEEMDFEISITSYQNKIRVNVTEVTELEKTICQIILSQEETYDLPLLKKKILGRIKQKLEKEYEDYEFLY